MNLKLVLCFAIVYIVYVSAGAKDMQNFFKQCKEEFRNDKKKFAVCLMLKMKVVDNGQIQPEAVGIGGKHMGSDNLEKLRTQTLEILNYCKDAGNGVEDMAEKNVKIAECLYDEVESSRNMH